MSMEKCYIFRKLINFVKDALIVYIPHGGFDNGIYLIC